MKLKSIILLGVLISSLFHLLATEPAYSATPTVTSVTPSTGPTDLPTSVTIKGTNFEPGARVSLINGGPFLAGSYVTDRASDVYVSGNYAYVVDGKAGLKIIDISDPASPVLVGSYETPGKAHAVYVSGYYAYVSVNYPWLGLLVIDISNSSTPTLAGKIPLDRYTVSMHISGNYIYLIDSYYFQIINISEPVAPELVVSLNLGFMDIMLLDLYASDGYAYVTMKDYSNVNSSIVFLIDVSDPTSPVVVSSINVPLVVSSVYVSGDYLYFAGASGLQVVDASDPTVPTLAGFIDVSDPRGREDPYTGVYGHPPVLPPDMYISDDYAYIVKESGLRIIDINDPAAPVLVSYYEVPGTVYDAALSVHVLDDYAYLIGKGFQVINVKNLRTRMSAGQIDITVWDAPAKMLSVRAIGDYAYVSVADVEYWDNHDFLGLFVIDVSNPASPTLQNSEWGYTWPLYPSYPDIAGMYASATDLYVADMSGFSWIKTSDPTALAGGGKVTSGRFYEARGVYVSGDYAYVTYFKRSYDEGPSKAWLWVINISDSISSTDERVVSKLRIQGSANDVYTSGDYAYVASGGAGLLVIDISDPTDPFFVTKYDTPGGARGVHVSGSYAYLADGKAGLLVIDISDPTEPELVNSYHTPGAANGIYVSDNYAYLASGSAGLQVIDVNIPTAPFLANSIDTPGIAYGVHASGNYVYLANGFAGLFVMDINNPVTNVVVADSSTITATFPEGFPEGPYHILVTNPGGQTEETYLYNAFKIGPPAPDITVTDSVFPFDNLQIPFGNVLHKMHRNRFIQMVSIANDGSADLNIGTIAQADTIDAPFSITADGCSNQTLTPSASCRLTIRFKPTVPGSFSDTFDIPSNDPDENSVTISVSGSKRRKMMKHR